MGGFEPPRTDPESAVLPLDDIPSKWLGREDSNPRMAGPKPAALPLGDCPNLNSGGEGGIRTLGGLLTHTRLAGVHLQPARSPLLQKWDHTMVVAEDEGFEPPRAEPGGFQDRCLTN